MVCTTMPQWSVCRIRRRGTGAVAVADPKICSPRWSLGRWYVTKNREDRESRIANRATSWCVVGQWRIQSQEWLASRRRAEIGRSVERSMMRLDSGLGHGTIVEFGVQSRKGAGVPRGDTAQRGLAERAKFSVSISKNSVPLIHGGRSCCCCCKAMRQTAVYRGTPGVGTAG